MNKFWINSIYIILLLPVIYYGQTAKSGQRPPAAAKSSPAYAEVLLRKVELQAEVESLLETYTEDFPKVKEQRYELGLIQKDIEKLLNQTDTSKLTQALGKLLVRRAELNTNLWVLQNRLGAEHPEVKRARRKVEGFDAAVTEIMP
jgi:uncharacterized protein involved in exopolysaccharide biosynthesis